MHFLLLILKFQKYLHYCTWWYLLRALLTMLIYCIRNFMQVQAWYIFSRRATHGTILHILNRPCTTERTMSLHFFAKRKYSYRFILYFALACILKVQVARLSLVSLSVKNRCLIFIGFGYKKSLGSKVTYLHAHWWDVFLGQVMNCKGSLYCQ